MEDEKVIRAGTVDVILQRECAGRDARDPSDESAYYLDVLADIVAFLKHGSDRYPGGERYVKLMYSKMTRFVVLRDEDGVDDPDLWHFVESHADEREARISAVRFMADTIEDDENPVFYVYDHQTGAVWDAREAVDVYLDYGDDGLEDYLNEQELLAE